MHVSLFLNYDRLFRWQLYDATPRPLDYQHLAECQKLLVPSLHLEASDGIGTGHGVDYVFAESGGLYLWVFDVDFDAVLGKT